MKANGGVNPGGKDRKRKIASDPAPAREQERTKVPQSASRRHREKINATLEELGGLLPLPEESRSKLDKLTVLKLSVSFFQTQNYLQSGKRKRRADDVAVNEITKQLEKCNINVSDISLEALDSFFLVLSETGDVFFASENVYRYLGYTQTFLMHQNFLNFVHHDDVVGFERCLRRSARARIMELDSGLGLDCKEFEEQPIPQVCFCSIKCHAGRQSSHVSPFYYRSFKFDGHIKPLLNGKMKQYGLFALCTPVNPANPFTSTPKELLQTYSCKMGLDLRIRKLDNRGQKSLFYSDKQAFNLSGYMVAHPDDIPCLMLAHQQLTATGFCEIVFRLTNGQGVYQWVRGKARTLYDKNDKPECVTADNILLNNEQGPYLRKVVYEMLCEWKAKQKGLPSPESEDDRSPANGVRPPTGAPPEAMLPTGAPPAPAASEQLQPGRPCPPTGLHPPDGPHPSSRPCSTEVLPPEGPLLPGRLLPPGRPHAPGRLHSPTVPLPPSAMESDGMSGGHQGLAAVMHDEDLLEDSKDIEIIEFNSPSTAVDSSVLPSFGLAAGSSESCMFSSPHLNRSPVEEKPSIAQDGTIYSFKTERRSGDASRIESRPNPSAYEQINLIKQFLMGGDPNPPSNVHQSGNTVRINGGSLHDSPPLWTNYPVETSPVLTEINFQEDDRGSSLYPPQNGMQSSFHTNNCRVPGISEGQVNLPQCGRPQQPDTGNLIYPFPLNMNGHRNTSNLFTNGVGRQDIPELPVSIDSLNKPMPNGSDFIPTFPFQKGSLHQSFKPQYHTGQNGFSPVERAGGFSKVADIAPPNHPAHDFKVNAGVAGVPRQDTTLWFSSTDHAQLTQDVDIPPIEEVLSVDDLTPSLCVEHMAPYRNPAKFQNGNIMESAVHTGNVFPPPNSIHMNQPMAQNVQNHNFQNTPANGKSVDPAFQSGGNSLLKMMLTL